MTLLQSEIDIHGRLLIGSVSVYIQHDPSSVQTPAAPPGTSPKVHHFAVHSCPLYVASSLPTYVAELFQAAIPVQIEDEGGLDETGGAVVVVDLEELDVGGGVDLEELEVVGEADLEEVEVGDAVDLDVVLGGGGGGVVLVGGGGATEVGAAGVSPILS